MACCQGTASRCAQPTHGTWRCTCCRPQSPMLGCGIMDHAMFLLGMANNTCIPRLRAKETCFHNRTHMRVWAIMQTGSPLLWVWAGWNKLNTSSIAIMIAKNKKLVSCATLGLWTLLRNDRTPPTLKCIAVSSFDELVDRHVCLMPIRIWTLLGLSHLKQITPSP